MTRLLPLKVAIIGRPNVGKSTIFNRLSGKRIALVQDRPGVTRDWQKSDAQLADIPLEIYDTAGLEGFENEVIKSQISDQTRAIIRLVDVVLFTVDARAALIAADFDLAKFLRSVTQPVVLLANKCEGRREEAFLHEAYRLGLGEPIPFSAEHGQGLDDLYDALRPFCIEVDDAPAAEEPDVEEGKDVDLGEEDEKSTMNLAIVGRPNVGKSTLINALLNENRVLTGDQPGVTRDAVTIPWSYQGHPIHLVDTAGMRRRARIDDSLEQMSVKDSLEAIRYANVVVLVMDAMDPLNNQDLTIAEHVLSEGRALVIALNKWDQADHGILPDLYHQLESSLSQAKGLTCVPISALKEKNLGKLMDQVFKTYKVWNTRVPTAKLNAWLARALERHAPPLAQGRRLRVKYVTQIKTRPPTFVGFVSKPIEMPDSYIRYLVTSLRETFDLPGVPIRFYLRQGKNPYDDKTKK